MGSCAACFSPRTLRRCEVYAQASLYWPLEEIDNAVNVAYLESGFNTGAWNQSGEDSRGLWQINVASGAHPELQPANLFDPNLNAYHAHRIWLVAGWRAWLNSARQLGILG